MFDALLIAYKFLLLKEIDCLLSFVILSVLIKSNQRPLCYHLPGAKPPEPCCQCSCLLYTSGIRGQGLIAGGVVLQIDIAVTVQDSGIQVRGGVLAIVEDLERSCQRRGRNAMGLTACLLYTSRPRRQSSNSSSVRGPSHRSASSFKMARSARAASACSTPLFTAMLPVKLWNEDEQ